MTGASRLVHRETFLWILALVVLILIRLPAMVQPAGSDQSLYMYIADRILDGGVPYVDAWDQKPPAVFFFYAAIRAWWPHASAVVIADVLSAAGVAWLLVRLGARSVGPRAGFIAATVFLALSHPSLARLSGLYVRGQCETFIILMVTATIASVWRLELTPWRTIAGGACLAVAFWLKYNAAAYALPVLVALAFPPGAGAARSLRSMSSASTWMLAGAAAASMCVVVFLSVHDAWRAWWLATITYNLMYAGETYNGGLAGVATYLIRLPFERASQDFLWFLGCAGAMLALVGGDARHRRLAFVAAAWFAAAVVSIVLNGARDLPQYFVQAGPALALLTGAGAAAVMTGGRPLRLLATAVLVIGLWRVGTDAPGLGGFRWGGFPGAYENVVFDVRHLRGDIDRTAYLARFKGAQKYDALESDALARLVRDTTRPEDTIFVLGFAPAVYLESQRLSASRFFWSRPVVLEFEADEPSYGSRGLLADLTAAQPAVIALQKQDWGPGEPNSEAFARQTPHLRDWLDAHYVLELDTPFFAVLRRRS